MLYQKRKAPKTESFETRMWGTVTGHHADRQEVGRCHTKGESHITYMPQPSANKAAHSGFENQRRYYQKYKIGVSEAQ